MQKIDLDKRNSFGPLDWLENRNEPSGAKLIESKINELVDAINVLQAQVAILQEHAHPTAKTEPEGMGYIKLDNDSLQRFLKSHPEYNNNGVIKIPSKEPDDPYAEQRKWIGKLCKFWDADSDDCYFDKLKEITPDGCYFTENGIWYCACEPVKPEDDIIYKGGDNE